MFNATRYCTVAVEIHAPFARPSSVPRRFIVSQVNPHVVTFVKHNREMKEVYGFNEEDDDDDASVTSESGHDGPQTGEGSTGGSAVRVEEVVDRLQHSAEAMAGSDTGGTEPASEGSDEVPDMVTPIQSPLRTMQRPPLSSPARVKERLRQAEQINAPLSLVRWCSNWWRRRRSSKRQQAAAASPPSPTAGKRTSRSPAGTVVAALSQAQSWCTLDIHFRLQKLARLRLLPRIFGQEFATVFLQK